MSNVMPTRSNKSLNKSMFRHVLSILRLPSLHLLDQPSVLPHASQTVATKGRQLGESVALCPQIAKSSSANISKICPYCPCFQSQIVWLCSSFHSCNRTRSCRSNTPASLLPPTVNSAICSLCEVALVAMVTCIPDQNWRHFPPD